MRDLRMIMPGCLRMLLMAALAVSPLRAAAQSPAPGEAPAQSDSSTETRADSPPQAALDHYLLGRRHYLAGRYRDALVELKAALEIDRNSADLLYNVARVYENLGEFDQAIEYYQRYLAVLPAENADERDRTEKTIRRLQGAKHEVAAPRPTSPVEPPSYGRADLAFWLTGGAALALFAGGGVTGYLALKKRHDVAAFVVGPDGTLAQRKKLVDQTERLALISDGLFIGGAVALTTATLLYILREREQQPAPAVGFHVGLDGRRAWLALHASF